MKTVRSHNTKKNPKMATLASNDFVSALNIIKIERVTLKNSQRNVISGIRYIPISLNQVWIALLAKGTPLQLKSSV